MNFSDLTTLRIGGPVKEVVRAETEEELVNNTQAATVKKQAYLVIGGGSNLLVSDDGFEGRVIQNQTKGKHILGNEPETPGSASKIVVKSGEILQDLVDFANEQGLAGLESLAGIPGTLGGAIYGNAGAYGQTISDHLLTVRAFDPTGYQTSSLVKEDCEFKYRDSIFKRNKYIILEAVFELTSSEPEKLIQTSLDIVKKREAKYPPGIKCPGSFFKNIIASELPSEVLAKIPEEKIVYGKIPAGTLLEMVGGKGDNLREIEIAPYHANLFINRGGGTARDFYMLAKKYYDKVKSQFGIVLEPEVQLINLPSFAD